MTKFLHVGFNYDNHERMMRNMTAKEKAEYNRCMANSVDVLTRSFEAHLQDLLTKSATGSLQVGSDTKNL